MQGDGESAHRLGSKEVQNEACTACRAVKRKCVHGDGADKGTCLRCQRLKLECNYYQAKRGRKPGELQARKRPRTSTQTDSATPAGDDWLREDLSRQQSAEPLVLPPTHQLYQPALPLPAHTQPHHQPIASTSTSTRFPEPVAHPPPRPPNTLFDHADPSPSDGSDGRDRLPTQPSPATGGFSLKKLLGGRSERPRHSLADAFAVDESPAEVNEAPKQYQDITMAGIVPEHSVPQLFDFFWTHLNPMTGMLDPALHSIDYVRQRSAFLYSAILTVTIKVAQPSNYDSAATFMKNLLGVMFADGVSNVEVVQTLAIVSFWGDSTDDSLSKKLAYAIRTAFELGMHKRAKRPLPEHDELLSRQILDRERTWMYLIIADHRFGTQRSLPRMIAADFREDPISWILERGPNLTCPSEALHVPCLQLSRLLDLYSALTSPDAGELPSRTILDCLEGELSNWTANWTSEHKPPNVPIRLHPAQSSLIRFYSRCFRLQLDEVHLLLSVSAPLSKYKLSFDATESPIIMFARAIRSGLAVLDSLREELKCLVLMYDTVFIGAASAAIWLVQNFAAMAPQERSKVIATLQASETACVAAAQGGTPHSMPIVMSRLLAHLLKKATSFQVPAPEESGGCYVPIGKQKHQRRGSTGDNREATSSSSDDLPSLNWGALGEVGSLGTSALMSNYGLGGAQQFSSGSASGTLMAATTALPSTESRPVQDWGSDFVYPIQDEFLWQALFPFYAQNGQVPLFG